MTFILRSPVCGLRLESNRRRSRSNVWSFTSTCFNVLFYEHTNYGLCTSTHKTHIHTTPNSVPSRRSVGGIVVMFVRTSEMCCGCLSALAASGPLLRCGTRALCSQRTFQIHTYTFCTCISSIRRATRAVRVHGHFNTTHTHKRTEQ